jgi:uncharacterized protein (TIGR00730 family)
MQAVCVYCGSNAGVREDYGVLARALGLEIARRDMALVYGGARVGLMGQVADAALAAGGRVVGIIPQSLVDKEIAHSGLTESHIVGSMHERKRMMADLSDGFVALPGGIGTLEEIFEMWTWAQLGYHAKPCALLDTAGYWTGLAAFLDHQVEEGFVRAPHRDMLLVDDDPARLLDRMEAYEPPVVKKWIKAGER